jgi:hypothetical protein
MNEERLLERVRKLLAHAENAATQAEADVFNAKAAELIARYGIQEALLAAAGKKQDAIGQRRIDMIDPYSADKAVLLGCVARPLRCRAVTHSRAGGSVTHCTVVGFESDLERVEMLYTSLLLQATAQLVRVRPARAGESVAAYRRSWLDGYATAVYRRLQAAEAKAAATEHTTNTDPSTGAGAGVSTELVLLDRTHQVDHALESMFPDLEPARRRTRSGSGCVEGYRAGERADLGTPTVAHPTRRELGT